MSSLVLASASPRRAELVQLLGFEVEVDPSDADEDITPTHPEEMVLQLAERKARHVADRHPTDVVVGADTVVALNGRIFGKPQNREAAVDAIRHLSGRTHDVHTGLCVIHDETGGLTADVTTTRVTFRELEEAEIHAYVDTDEPYDKAGAYGVQGRAAIFVERIDGCYYNVVGLPVTSLYQMLKPYRTRLRSADQPSINLLTALRDA